MRGRGLLSILIVVGVLVGPVGPAARTAPATRLLIPIVGKYYDAPPVEPNGLRYEADLTADGFEPSVLTASPGSQLAWRNTTGADISLVITSPGAAAVRRASGTSEVTVQSGQVMVQQFPQPGSYEVHKKERPDHRQTVVVDPAVVGTCADPAPRPAPPTAPAALVSPPAPTCPGLAATAPAAVAKMPTSVGGISIGYEYDTFPASSRDAPFRTSYRPAQLVREHFGRLYVDGDCAGCWLLLRGPSWATDVSIEFRTATPGTALKASPSGRVWGRCQGNVPYPLEYSLDVFGAPYVTGSPPAAAPFDGTLYEAGRVDARTNLGARSISVRPSVVGGCWNRDAQGNYTGDSRPMIVGAIELLGAPGLVFDDDAPGYSTGYGRVGTAADLRYKVLIGGVDLGDFTSHLYTAPEPHRRQQLGIAADARGGLFNLNVGEYVAPLHLFTTQGLGVAASLDLTYRSVESLRYRGGARHPDREKHFADAPVGQGWAYTYGMRVNKRPAGAPSGQSQLYEYEVVAPNGLRATVTGPSSGETGAPLGFLLFGSRRATLEIRAGSAGYRLWSPDSFDEYSFDREGRLTEIRWLPYATPLTVAYPDGEQVVTDSGGKVTRFRFSGDRISEVVDPLGQTWSLGYTGDSLTSVSHGATGYRWRFAYDPNSFLLTGILDPDCRLTTARYATGGESAVATHGAFLGSTNSAGAFPIDVTYSGPGVVAVKDPEGFTTTYDAGNVVYHSLSYVKATDPVGGVHRFLDYERPIAYVDPGGNGTWWTETRDMWLDTVVHYRAGSPNGSGVAFGRAASPNAPADNVRRLTTIQRLGGGTAGDDVAERTVFQYDGNDRVVRVVKGGDDEANPTRATKIEYDAVGRQNAVTDGEGRVTRYTYGTQPGQTNLVASETRENPDGTPLTIKYTYDELGNVKSIDDGRGLTRYDYDPMGRLTKITAPGGSASGVATRQLAYDAMGRVVKERNGRGHDTVYGYDPLGRPTSIATPDGATASVTRDNRGLVKTQTNAPGGTTTFAYDNAGRLETTTGPHGQSSGYAYDASSNPKTITRNGATTDYVFDGYGQLEKVTYPARTIDGTSFRPTESFDHIKLGPLHSRTTTFRPGKTQSWRYRYDAEGRPFEGYANGEPTLYTRLGYDKSGLVSSWTAPDAPPSRVASGATPSPGAVSSGQPARTYTVKRDAFGRQRGLVDPAGKKVAAWDYDASGNLTRVSSPAPNGSDQLLVRASGEYDERGQLVKAWDARARSLEMAYDGNGNLVWTKDHRSCTTVHTYDAGDRVTRIVRQAPQPGEGPARQLATDYGYDLAGNVTSMTGPYEVAAAAPAPAGRAGQDGPVPTPAPAPPANAPSRAATHDKSNRVETLKDPSGRSFKIEYDGDNVGKVIDLTDGSYRKFEYEAGVLRRVIEGGAVAETREFDAHGRPLLAQRGEFSQRWPDYLMNATTPSTAVWTHTDTGGTAHSFTLKLRPDEKGNVAELTEPDSTVVSYRYEADLLKSVERGAMKWTYDYYQPSKQLKTLTLPNGFVVEVKYDEKDPKLVKDWIVKKSAAAEAPEVAHWVYHYQPNGIAVTERVSSNERDYMWQDDGLGSEGIYQRSGALRNRLHAQTFAYAGGDRLSVAYGDRQALTRFHEYVAGTHDLRNLVDVRHEAKSTPLYQLHDRRSHVVRASPSNVFSPAAIYQYDDAGRLTQVIDPFRAAYVEYRYLADGELARRRDNQRGETTYYVDFGFGLFQELDAEYRPRATYVNDPLGNKLARLGGSAEYYVYGPDGSIAMSVAPDGTVRRYADVDSFGAQLRDGNGNTTTAPPGEQFGYAASFRDPATGLILFDDGVWYDPDLARFLQPSSASGTDSPHQFAGLAPYHEPDMAALLANPLERPLATLLPPSLAVDDPTALLEFAQALPIASSVFNAFRRNDALRGHKLTTGQAASTAGALFVGELLPIPATGAIESWVVDYNTLDGGRQFTTGEKVMTGVEIGLSAAVWRVTGKLARGEPVTTGARLRGAVPLAELDRTSFMSRSGASNVWEPAGRGGARVTSTSPNTLALLQESLRAEGARPTGSTDAFVHGPKQASEIFDTTGGSKIQRAVARLELLRKIDGTNPLRGTNNCKSCALAVDQRLEGIDALALPDEMSLRLPSSDQMGFKTMASRGAIEREMARLGPGAKGQVSVEWSNGDRHRFNVVNRRGFVFFVDGQAESVKFFTSRSPRSQWFKVKSMKFLKR